MASAHEEFNLFRLAASPIRDYYAQCTHHRNSSRILTRLVEAERRAIEKASDLQRMREKV